MQQEISSNNSISLIGTIVSDFVFSHEVYGEGFFNFDLEVSRLSENTDTLPITISERLFDKSKIGINSLVKIAGQIRSYNNYVEADNKNRLVLTIFVKDLEIPENQQEENPNNAYLNGYICKTPSYRTTPFGREIADILLAINRSYNKSDYIPCIAWGRNARFASKLRVGDNIGVWGRMQSRKYQKKLENGELLERTAYEVSISKIDYATAEEENKFED